MRPAQGSSRFMNWPALGFSSPSFLVLLVALPLVYLVARRARRERKVRASALTLWLRLGAVALLRPGPVRAASAGAGQERGHRLRGRLLRQRPGGHPRRGQDLGAPWPCSAPGRTTRSVSSPSAARPASSCPWAAPATTPSGASRRRATRRTSAAPSSSAADAARRRRRGSMRRIVLLSDGNETRGDAQRALLRPPAAGRGGRRPLACLSGSRTRPSPASSLPPALRDGEPAELRLASTSPLDQPARCASGPTDRAAGLPSSRSTSQPARAS